MNLKKQWYNLEAVKKNKNKIFTLHGYKLKKSDRKCYFNCLHMVYGYSG